jgi:predicted TIM-barrel fold metal-dependent hydrolase
MSLMTSLVCNGVFDKFPSLQFAIIESGLSWLPHLLWRFDTRRSPGSNNYPPNISAHYLTVCSLLSESLSNGTLSLQFYKTQNLF